MRHDHQANARGASGGEAPGVAARQHSTCAGLNRAARSG
jgi:hypothetical protein